MTILRGLTYFLWMICLTLCGVMFYLFSIPVYDQDVAASEQFSSYSNEVAPKVEGSQDDRTSFEVYEKVFSAHDAFQPKDRSARVAQAEPQAGSLSTFAAFKKQYSIVGIIINNYSQVVFRDQKNNETFFLTVGDSIGNAVIEQIRPGVVDLKINGYSVEMIP